MPSPIAKVIERVASVKQSAMKKSAMKRSAEKRSTMKRRSTRGSKHNSNLAKDIARSSTASSTGIAPAEEAASSEQVNSRRKHITWKRVLYHPLTWLAVGLHVALLVVPFNPAPPAAVETEEETEETDEAIPIDLLNLSDIATSEPPPPAPPENSPPPPPANVPPVPAAPVPQTPVAQAPTPAPATPDPVQIPDPVQPTPDPAQPTQPAYDPSGDQKLFVDNLGAIGLNTYDLSAIGLPTAREFKEPANAPSFLNGDAPVPTAKSVQQIDKEPADVFNQLQTSYASTGITFTQEPAYGGEELYHAITPTGETLMYFSLVRLKGSTLLVIWNDRPA